MSPPLVSGSAMVPLSGMGLALAGGAIMVVKEVVADPT